MGKTHTFPDPTIQVKELRPQEESWKGFHLGSDII